MTRDRTARTRIRHFLATSGPVADGSGHATTTLRDAIGYAGTAVAFIQLIAAMARDGEIEREIRGKRTYRISLTEAARTLSERDSAWLNAAYDAQGRGGTAAPASTASTIDYDHLARALVERLLADHERVVAERDDYARRLVQARQQIDALLDGSLVE